MKIEDEIYKAYQLSIKYLAVRSRSVYEIELYLEKKGYDKKIVENIIDKLKKQNLLDDNEFASMFVDQRERFKPKSKFALAFELKKKGIEQKVIDTTIEDINEYDSALSAVKQKVRLWKHYDKDKFSKKVLNFLRNRGFNYDVSMSALNSLSDADCDCS